MATTKVDFKAQLRAFYSARPEPALVEVPEMAFLMIDGHGDPNTAPEYPEAVQALYQLSYAAMFTVKRQPGGVNYAVMPLEGLWWVPDMSTFSINDKSAWDWTMLIMQPEQVTLEVFEEARAKTVKKATGEAITRVRLERFAEGAAAQVLHAGPYATEGPTIRQLHEFISAQGLSATGKHHEVYLSDPRRVAPEKMKTILRQPVATSQARAT